MNDIRLPKAITETILTFGEHTMGAYKVRLLLRDGRTVEPVFVAWGDQVVRLPEDAPPFDVEDVVGVVDLS